MNIVVTNENIDAVFFELDLHNTFGLDTETTGLNPYKGDKLFSLIISTYKDNFYFNFNDKPDHMGNLPPEDTILDRKELRRFRPLFNNIDNTFYIHNAKFDMHFLDTAINGLRWVARIVCTNALARLVNNQLNSYSLEALGELIGVEKDDTVDKYISKHKLYTEIDVGKKKPKKNKHFDLVPFGIISNYGMRDGEVVFTLGVYIESRLKELALEQKEMGLPDLNQVVLNEIKLTKTLFKMEKRGIRIDRKYCQEAYEYEMDEYNTACSKFYALTDGIEFQDAAACFKEAFQKLGLQAGKTDKGNDSYSADNLPKCDLTDVILTARKHYKRATTYFKNFLDLADDNDIIHCNFKQAGTATGRLSASEPNLQNVPKRGEDKSIYPVRKAFIPREGKKFVMQDADAGEYKLLLDLTNEKGLIEKVNNGLDVHTATAKEMGVERTPAKTLNFMIIYGGGNQKLADALNVTLSKAKQMKQKYFMALPNVKKFTQAIKTVSKTRGFIVNWLGRRLLCKANQDYKMLNHYIQGGLGDIVKVAMNNIDTEIIKQKLNVEMLLQIHDEILYELPIDEEDCIEILENTLVKSYPYTNLKLTWGTDIGLENWFKKEAYNG